MVTSEEELVHSLSTLQRQTCVYLSAKDNMNIYSAMHIVHIVIHIFMNF